jgi:Tfp pilus assembly protein FimV
LNAKGARREGRECAAVSAEASKSGIGTEEATKEDMMNKVTEPGGNQVLRTYSKESHQEVIL